jgi:hypothetical protein
LIEEIRGSFSGRLEISKNKQIPRNRRQMGVSWKDQTWEWQKVGPRGQRLMSVPPLTL